MSRAHAGDKVGNIAAGTPVVDRDLTAQPSGPVSLVAGDVSASLIRGAVAWELVFSPSTSMVSQQVGSPVICLCEATTSAGSLTLQYEAGRWFLRLAGAAVLEVLDPEDGASGTYRNNLSQTGLAGDYVRVLFGYAPSDNLLFLQVQVNGCSSFLATNRAGVSGTYPAAQGVLTAVSSVTAITVGSRIDTSLSLGAQWKRFRAFDWEALSGNPPETVLVLGDSTDSALSYSPAGSACAATPSHVFTPAEAATFTAPRIRNQAIGGQTIGLQQTTFTANLALYGGVRCVVLGPGINDANGGASGATMIASYQALVSAVKASLPGVTVVARLVTPCKAFLASNWSGVAALNAAILAGTITGIDAVASAHYAAMSDGSDNLSSIYDSGDHVHPHDSGRAAVGSSVRGALAALGFVTYDASTAPGCRVVVFTGDSITAGQGLSQGVNDFSSVAISQFNAPWLWKGGGIGAGNFATYNVGVGGSTAANKITADRTAVDPKLTSAYHNLVVFFAGANDLYLGASIATAIANVDAAVALYPAGSIVGVVTPLPRTYAGTPSTFEADRLTLRAHILAKYGSNAIDFGGDAVMGNVATCSDATKYQDLVHPTAGGDALLAPYVSAWANSVAA